MANAKTVPMTAETDPDPALRLAAIREATRNVKCLKGDVRRLAEEAKYARKNLKLAQATLEDLGDPKGLPLFPDSEDESLAATMIGEHDEDYDDDEELGD